MGAKRSLYEMWHVPDMDVTVIRKYICYLFTMDIMCHVRHTDTHPLYILMTVCKEHYVPNINPVIYPEFRECLYQSEHVHV